MQSIDSIVNLYEFRGTVATNVTISPKIDNFRFIGLALYDTETRVAGIAYFPKGTMLRDGVTVNVYGSSSSMWGSMSPYYIGTGEWTDAQLTLNRTASNTVKLIVFGIY